VFLNHLNEKCQKNNSYFTVVLKNTRWADALLFLTAFFVLFWGLGGRELWGSEGRWAQVTSEMLQNRDFFHPTIGGEPYFDKPLLTYWLIVAVHAVTGSLSEWVIRLPSAIAGVITIWATVLLGRRLWSARVGRLAGWLLLTTYGLLFWSRTAAADTENLAAVTLGILWYWTRRDKPNFTTFVVFYLIAFLGALTKGLGAVAVPIVAILPDLILEKRWKALLKPSHFIALGLGCIVYLSPFIYASRTSPETYHSSGLMLVFQENIQRYFSPFDHTDPFYIYLYAVPMLLLPWAPLFIASLVGMLLIWKELDAKNRWLLSSIIMIFLFFTLSGSRRHYYILPITPLCAILMGVFVNDIVSPQAKTARDWGLGIQKYVGATTIAIQIALPFALFIFKAHGNAQYFISLGISGIVLGVTAWLVNTFIKRSAAIKISETQEIQDTAALIGTAVIIMGGFFCWQYDIMGHYRTERSFVQELKARTEDFPVSATFAIFPKYNANLLYYLGQNMHVQSIHDPDSWERFLENKQQPKVLITQRRYISQAPWQYAFIFKEVSFLVETINPWDSASSRKEKWAAWLIDNDQSLTNTNLVEKEKK
jgi:4-amino-4-deoxy-L-arabinose transferase-like glycosyltransferase